MLFINFYYNHVTIIPFIQTCCESNDIEFNQRFFPDMCHSTLESIVLLYNILIADIVTFVSWTDVFSKWKYQDYTNVGNLFIKADVIIFVRLTLIYLSF
jgi:hypothetical protein